MKGVRFREACKKGDGAFLLLIYHEEGSFDPLRCHRSRAVGPSDHGLTSLNL